MIDILFTIYCLLGVVYSAVLVLKLLVENKFSKKWYWYMFVFFPFTFTIFVVCWISYSYNEYNNKKEK